MKINLIIPPDFFLGDDKRNAPLGVLYVAAITRDAGYELKINDLRGVTENNLVNKLDLDSDIYGFTSSTPSYYTTSTLAKKVKVLNPKALTVLGRIHATSLPHEMGLEFDKVVVGEGERSFLQILEDYKNNTNSNKRIYHSSLIENLDSIPFPARDLIPFDSAFSKDAFFIKGEYAGTIITSRGCPGNCSFCGSKMIWGRRTRFRSPDNVLEEIEKVKSNYGIKYFKFYDDTVALKKDRLIELANGIKSIGIHWKAATRVDFAGIDVLNMMRQSGCEEVAYGIESLDQEVLDKNNKGITLNQVYETMRNTKKVGLKSRVYFIVGLPGEKPGFSNRLEKFLDETNPDAVDISTFVAFPGSPIYHNPKKWGINLKSSEFKDYIMTLGLKNGELSKNLTFEHDVLTEEEIKEERAKSIKLIKDRNQVQNF